MLMVCYWVSGKFQNVLSGNFWLKRISNICCNWTSCFRCCGSACELLGLICQQTSYHSERTRKASLRCETSCDPGAATAGRRLCGRSRTCGWGCGSECASAGRGWTHTSCGKCGSTWHCRLSIACGFDGAGKDIRGSDLDRQRSGPVFSQRSHRIRVFCFKRSDSNLPDPKLCLLD